ncbi:AI-2E family transporter [Herbiconiux sp. VKM Ac-1786]|uniref:AI-2E family transporter n=1 Tax=Herbiconiux sp. VKM Ac-1786 TaxID=2783824 RepID=UPI00188C28BB|nr:AI-2E family transporter [Herbiconiux sp. VKM Ac-1786]MBF4573103.1 AI-2E family transporter [Herbiconiux sp. VKM Ac-1786]
MPTDDSALARPNPPGSASPTPTDLGPTDPGHTDPASRPSLRSMLTDKFGQLALRSLQIIVVLILATVVVFALVQLKLVVIPLLIAIILAAAVSPVLRWLKHHGFSAMMATWVTLVAAILVFGGLITLIVFAVRGQWDELGKRASEGVDNLQGFVRNLPFDIDQSQIEDAKNSALDFLTSSQFGSGALAGVSAAGEVITGAVLAIVILFFFMKDGPQIWAFLLKPSKGYRHERGERIGHTAVRTLGGYIRGTAVVALVDSVAIGVGVAIVGVPLALPLAIIVFVGAFIPLIGATLAGVLAALVALVANGPVAALVVVGIVIAVNQLEGNFLQPVVMAQSLKLHPLVILVALTAGTILGGIVGAVLSVPIAAVGWAIIKVWNGPAPEPEPHPKRRKKNRAPKAEPPTTEAVA